MKTLVLGLGNTLRGDDGIGLQITETIIRTGDYPSFITIESTISSGISLLSYFHQYERVCIVDAVEVEEMHAGTLWRLTADELARLRLPVRLTHGLGVHTLLELNRRIGYDNPLEVLFFLVGIAGEIDPYKPRVCDEISPALRERIPEYVRTIRCEFETWATADCR